jgi:flagellar biosynthetic protein FliR
MDHLSNIFQYYYPGLAITDALLFFLLIFTRWAVMSTMMPFLGAQLLPSPIRVSLAFMLSLLSFIVLIGDADFSQDQSIFLIGLLFIKEALLGFILGFFASLIFYTYELLGEFIDFFRAAGMSKLLVPELKTHASPMGVTLFQLALVLFLALGLHREVLLGAYQSFEIFPVLSFGPNFLNDDFFISTTQILNALFKTAFKLSLPVLTVCLLIDLGFGLLNRVAPHINAYFLSLPAKMIGGLIILFFVLPFLIDDFVSHYQEFSEFFYRVISRRTQ